MQTVLTFYSTHQALLIQALQNLVLTVVIFVVASVIAKLVKRGVFKATEKVSGGDEIVARLLSQVASYAVYLVALVIVLDLFGVNTASLVALVGAAGLAVGLALKDTLSNIAAGIMILFLKPIKKGEFVEFGSYSGSVVDIGLFTSVFEMSDGVYISSPNSTVWNSTIRNFSRNHKRRMDITVSISYQDSVDVGLQVLKEIAAAEPHMLKDPAPKVLVHMLADSSVNLQLRAWCPTDKYWETYWSVQKALKPQIEAAGLTIPFPQREIHVISKDRT